MVPVYMCRWKSEVDTHNESWGLTSKYLTGSTTAKSLTPYRTRFNLEVLNTFTGNKSYMYVRWMCCMMFGRRIEEKVDSEDSTHFNKTSDSEAE